MRKRILVVDDDPDLVTLLNFNLRKAGYAVATARDGVEALKKARSVRADLILLDLMLPEIDGFAVCEILRRDSSTASIPILILTALTSQLGRLAGFDCGATDYLTKPFSPRLLLFQIEQTLKSPRALT